MKKVAEVAFEVFGEAVGVYETYGTSDILIRVWTVKERKDKFVTTVRERLSQVDVYAYEVAELYPDLKTRPDEVSISRMEALGLQESVPPYPTRFKHLVLSEFSERPPVIKAFTFVEARSAEMTGGVHVMDGFRLRVSQLQDDSRTLLYIFRPGSRPAYLCMVEFMCRDFNTVWEVPSRLVEGDDERIFGTSTLLATNRLIFESDQVRP